jgi:hypothetical protein
MVKASASLSYYSRPSIFSTDVGTDPTLPLYNLNLLIWVGLASQFWCSFHRIPDSSVLYSSKLAPTQSKKEPATGL